jgi:hypothetical protein
MILMPNRDAFSRVKRSTAPIAYANILSFLDRLGDTAPRGLFVVKGKVK